MIYSVMQLDLQAALRYNAVMLVFFMLLSWSWLAWLGRTVGISLPDWLKWRYAGHAVLAVMGIWFVVRLVPFEPFLSLRV